MRNNRGEMIPLATFIKVSDTSGPDRVMHYNGFITAEINGAAAPGYSSGQAEKKPSRNCSRTNCPTA
nr:hypothetical protein GCM10020185_72890 [Pseudomonas brassicacearum subsp. brassicacearum]